MKKKLLSLIATLLSTTACASKNDLPELVPYPKLELSQIMGVWYVIEVIPSKFEKGCKNSVENYSLDDEGRVDVVFTCDKPRKDGVEKFKLTQKGLIQNAENTVWKIRYKLFGFIPIHFPYIITDAGFDSASQSEYLVVGFPSREYVWVMSRSKTLGEDTLKNIREKLKNEGYDLSKLIKVEQN